jgi:Asp-tRNA(Asn)/Glu-tRNA(Gln) amidotransferase A subunit family amidase
VADVHLPEWDEVTAHAGAILVAEAWRADGALLEADPGGVGADVAARLRLGAPVDDGALDRARQVQERWQARLADLFDEFEALATPTLTIFPPTLAQGEDLLMARCTLPVNFGGVPALSLPVPAAAALPASLQLIGPWHAESALLAAGLVVEAAVAA